MGQYMAKKIFIIVALLPFIVILINMTIFKKQAPTTEQAVSVRLKDINTLEG
jgi:hypothetical protein